MKGLLLIINDWKSVLLACFLLGLAPFFPEPHILGKIRWVAGGAIGMKPIDWFDLVWHGLPFVLLVRLVLVKAYGLLLSGSGKD